MLHLSRNQTSGQKKSGRVAAAGLSLHDPGSASQKKPRRCHQPAFFGLPSLSASLRVDLTVGVAEEEMFNSRLAQDRLGFVLCRTREIGVGFGRFGFRKYGFGNRFFDGRRGGLAAGCGPLRALLP